MPSLIDKFESDKVNHILVFVYMIALFFAFHLKWIHLQHDVGREMYQAFAISLQGKTVYTELTHYFGPLAPYSNALLLNIFGATLFNFSLIGFFVSLVISFTLYNVARHILNPTDSVLTILIFIGFSVINTGGGGLFMPYSYAHSYGILFTTISVFILIKLLYRYNSLLHFLFIASTALLVFTKQEYLLVFGSTQLIWAIILFQKNRSNFIKLGILHLILQTGVILIFYSLFFTNFTVFDLLEQSKSMFEEHNKGVLHNFLTLYSPSTFKLAILFLSAVSIGFVFEMIWKKHLLFSSIIILINVSIYFFFWETIIQEFFLRGFFLNWLTLIYVGWLFIRLIKEEIEVDALFVILFISLSLYSRQQSASWMWQGLNWIIFFYSLNQLSAYFKLKYTSTFIALSLLLLSTAIVPLKLNQTLEAKPVINELGEELFVKPEWHEPIQKAVAFIESLPSEKTLYCGQETGWMNAFTRRFNNIRNQQWWGYMKVEIIEDVFVTKPDYVLITYYKKPDGFRFFGGGGQIFAAIDSLYTDIKIFQNESIKIQILELNRNSQPD